MPDILSLTSQVPLAGFQKAGICYHCLPGSELRPSNAVNLSTDALLMSEV